MTICVAVIAFGGACRIHPGANHVLLVTKSNSGLDIDTLPAAVEVSLFGRFDGVHAPTFEGAQTVPVVTSFQRNAGDGALKPVSGAFFASGPAAMAVASPDEFANGLTKYEAFDQMSSISLSDEPCFARSRKRLFAPGEAPPFWFGTTETTGIQLELYGPSVPPVPQSFHAGYRRKEFLIAPLHMRKDGAGPAVVVETPSVLAAVNIVNDERGGDSPEVCRKHAQKGEARRVQLFATGQAATRLAATPEVRKLFLDKLVEKSDGDCPVCARAKSSADGAGRSSDRTAAPAVE